MQKKRQNEGKDFQGTASKRAATVISCGSVAVSGHPGAAIQQMKSGKKNNAKHQVAIADPH